MTSLWRDLVGMRRSGHRPEMVAICLTDAQIPADVMALRLPPNLAFMRWLVGLDVVVVTDNASIERAVEIADWCLRSVVASLEVFNAEARKWALVLCADVRPRVLEGLPAWD